MNRVVALSYNKVHYQILLFIKDDVLFLVILACSHKGSRSLNKFLLQKKIIIKNNVHNFVKKWPDIVTQIFFFFFLRWDFKGNRECKNKINYNKMEKIKYLWQMNFWDEIFKWYRFWQMRLIHSWCKLIGGTWFAQNKKQIKRIKRIILVQSKKKKNLRRELWILNERKSILNYEGTALFEK